MGSQPIARSTSKEISESPNEKERASLNSSLEPRSWIGWVFYSGKYDFSVLYDL